MKLVQLLGNVGQKRVSKSSYVGSGDASLTGGLVAVVLHEDVTSKTNSFHFALNSTSEALSNSIWACCSAVSAISKLLIKMRF
jgi:fructose-1-phosphate kinase PfkB-like protein